MATQEQIQRLLHFISQGNDILLGQHVGEKRTVILGWIIHTSNGLREAGASDGLIAEWFGLPTPMIVEGNSIPWEDIQRSLQARTSWLGTVVSRLASEGRPGESGGVPVATHIAEPTDKGVVFVVHGRNLRLRDAMFMFLRTIGLKPLEWNVAVKSTQKTAPYVGEILDSAFSRAQAVLILLTPDDEARLLPKFHHAGDPPHEKSLTPQARPNVIFEAGMALGRFPERTVLVEVGTLRPFSDVAGRHVIRLNNSSQRRQELAERLETAGCPVDLTGLDWHSASTGGNFSLEVTE